MSLYVEGIIIILQVDSSRKEMENVNLMSQVEKLKFEKQDLEDRCKDLEERSKSQENTISYLQTENERLIMRRSTSPTGSLHRPQHYGKGGTKWRKYMKTCMFMCFYVAGKKCMCPCS